MNIFNRFLISIVLLLGAISTFSHATGTGTNIITEDKTNASMLNTLDATDIVNLSAYITNSTSVISNFIIKSLPDANVGILYMADGTTVVTVGQRLTRVEADGLKFDPIESCTATNARFTYVGVNSAGVEGTVATVTIPLTVGAGCSATVTSDDKNNPDMLNTVGAVDISDLSGNDENGNAVTNFIITSLPRAEAGVLYMADGTTPVQVNQTLTLEEANGLKFDPVESCTAMNAQFTYVAVNSAGVKGTVATVTIPLTVGAGCSATVTSDDKNNPNMLNTLGAVNILDLSGKDGNGDAVTNFIITSLPHANQGILYMADGTTAVRLNQTLTLEEANGLKFDPNANFEGDVTFTYVALDNNGVRGNVATVTIPLVAPVVGNQPTADNKNNPEMSNTLGAVNILDLSGKDENGDAVNQFIITSLPNANQGVLYMADGTTPVQLNQTLTLAEANGLRFDPTAGFVGNVTFTYVVLDDNGIKSTNATVTIPLVNPINNLPTADDKVNPTMLNTLGAVNILDLSGKDTNGDAVKNFIITSLPDVRQGVLYLADGTTAVRLNQTLTLAQANGLKFDPNIDFVGDVKFTYVAIDSNGVKSSNATVTIPVVASHNTDIVTHDDAGVASGNADPIVIDVLANDRGTLAGATVRLVNTDGTFTDEVTVDGEGVWSVNADNMIIFTPVAPFVGTPTPVDYVVRDVNGGVSNTSTISINGQCVCKPYTEDIPVFSTLGLFLMMLLSMLVGLRFIKKEL